MFFHSDRKMCDFCYDDFFLLPSLDNNNQKKSFQIVFPKRTKTRRIISCSKHIDSKAILLSKWIK